MNFRSYQHFRLFARGRDSGHRCGGSGSHPGSRSVYPGLQSTFGRVRMDYKIELIAVPVSDVDRAKAFYTDQAGFNADHDHKINENLRFVQLTPPGSHCSIAIGTGVDEREPGSAQGLQMVVSDIEAAHAELSGRGLDVGEIQDFPWGRFIFFKDPDGNGWAVQQIPQ